MYRRISTLLLILCTVLIANALVIPPRQWSRSTGFSWDACVATNGDAFLVGTLSGTVDFGDTSATSVGIRDIFVVRYDDAGNTVWVRTAGEAGALTFSNWARGVVPRPDGGCIVAGEFSGILSFDSTHTVADTTGPVFVAGYAADGSVLWATSYGSPDYHTVVGAAPDNAGGCYTLSHYFGIQDAHVALTHHDAAGNLQWQLDGTDGYAHAIGGDADGNAVIAGVYNSPFTLGDSTLSMSEQGMFLAKVSPAGVVLWLREYATGAGITANDIAVDASGAIYVCGSFLYSPTIGDTTLTTNSIYFDGFLASHDADGAFQWAREIDAAGTIDEAELRNLAITPEGNCVATARFFHSVIVDGDTLLGSEGHDGGLMVEWASDGTLLDYLSVGSGQGANPLPRPIAINTTGTIYRYSVDDTLSGPNIVGHSAIAAGIRPAAPRVAAELLPNYPNPFNPTTIVSFRLDEPAHVQLVIFDAAGRRVRTLATGAYPDGVHHETWDGQDDRGHAVTSGVYFVQLRAGSGVDARKLVLIK